MSPETIVIHKGHGLPYSKGLMAQSLSASGLSLERSFELAREIERRLALRGDREGESAVRRYLGWRRLDRLDRPLVVLIGGTTGVGKSTLATMLAGRLGITRVIATDVIRQVLRAFFTVEAMPTVHFSAFDAGGIEACARAACSSRRSSSFATRASTAVTFRTGLAAALRSVTSRRLRTSALSRSTWPTVRGRQAWRSSTTRTSTRRSAA